MKSGITIYQSSGKAAEYSRWACNLYNGCSNQCDYCYNRRGIPSKLLGKSEVTTKRGLPEDELFEIFKSELDRWRELIIKDGGIHFNFVSDPCLTETYILNLRCIKYAIEQCVPVQMLTKMHDFIWRREWRALFSSKFFDERRSLIKFGFTLTGMDEMEPGASNTMERLYTMRRLHDRGYQTWASIEPVIEISKSYALIKDAWDICDEFRIGLLSGKKEYSKQEVKDFVEIVFLLNIGNKKTIVFKESVLNFIRE